jgi:hypothetical protein
LQSEKRSVSSFSPIINVAANENEATGPPMTLGNMRESRGAQPYRLLP